MKIQITVRVDEELVEYVDHLVEAGEGSRAAVVSEALRRLKQHRLAERDRDILTATGDYDDLEGLAGYAAAQPTDA